MPPRALPILAVLLVAMPGLAAAATHRAQPRAPSRPAAQTRCIGVTGMAGATVIGDRAVELTMNAGNRWRMNFERECPALSFYQGFYYRRSEPGRLCAGRDAVIARSGGECLIASIVPLRPLRRR